VVKAKDKSYHEACFTCSVCTHKLDAQYYETPDGDYYCGPCHEAEFLPNCDVCKEKIRPSRKEDANIISTVVFKDKKYHEDCFKCVDCSQQFKVKVRVLICFRI
jgi:hypothetical protein